MFHTLKPLQRRKDIHGYIPIVIYSNMEEQVKISWTN